jgi:hypothetical protein
LSRWILQAIADSRDAAIAQRATRAQDRRHGIQVVGPEPKIPPKLRGTEATTPCVFHLFDANYFN